MTFAFLVLAFLSVVNPARVRLSLPEEAHRRAKVPIAAAGAALLFVLAVLGVAASMPILDWLEISPETWRIAAGLIVLLAGAWVMGFPKRHEEPALSGSGEALVPVLFPVLLTPELVALVVSTGADEPTASVLGSLAIALAAALGLGMVANQGVSPTVLRGLSRLLGGLAVVAGVVLLISGIRDV